MGILDSIAMVFGQILYAIFNSVSFGNYGIAIIVFTIIVRALLMPLRYKSMKSNARMQAYQPQIKEIQRRYKNDKEKLQSEQMKFYKENNISMTGGCLPSLLQIPLTLSMFYTVTRPLTFLLGLGQHMYNDTLSLLDRFQELFFEGGMYREIGIITGYKVDQAAEVLKSVPQLIGSDVSERIVELRNGMGFLGLNLGDTPVAPWNFSEYISNLGGNLILTILPAISIALVIVSIRLSMRLMAAPAGAAGGAGASKVMMYIMPLFTLFIAFSAPLGLTLYWSAGYVVEIFTQLYANKVIYVKEREKAQKEMDEAYAKGRKKGPKAALDEGVEAKSTEELAAILDDGPAAGSGGGVKALGGKAQGHGGEGGPEPGQGQGRPRQGGGGKGKDKYGHFKK
ncbi:MAG: YidC/Oxa1 family membrane protein insertase [Oscillospiraceae bacterium]|nr:YidC/Oxa1 family membrane protein insertase [Oscillospiraceae bacterium]